MTQYMVVQPYPPRRRRRRRHTQVIVPLKRDLVPAPAREQPALELTITHTTWGPHRGDPDAALNFLAALFN